MPKTPKTDVGFPVNRVVSGQRMDTRGQKRVARCGEVLPPPRTSFIGRAAETEALAEILLRPKARAVTLTGAPGIGKTRLALEVAGSLAGRFSSGTAFVDLSAVTDPAAVGAAIAQALGVREVSAQPLLETLRNAIAGQRLLLVLDNFEQVLPAAPVVAVLLDGCPSLTVLLTSRAPLRITGEQEFPVPPLALPERRSAAKPQALSEVASVALFVERARAVRPEFTLTSANAAAVADICIRLDGIPLAIELAAARVKLLTPLGILRRLRSSLDLLSRQSPDVPPRHRTLRQAIRWSYELLQASEQVLLRRLAVFSGGATLDAVETVCREETDPAGGVLDGLASLVDNSLLLQDPQPDGESRFRMLETIREFAREELEASAEGPALWERHAAYFAQLAQTAEPALVGPDQAVWLDRLEREHDNFRAALAWAAEADRAEIGLTIAAALGRFWERHGYSGEGLSWLQRLLPHAPQVPAALRATALNIAGNLARSRGDYALAVSCYEETLALRRGAQDARGIAIALNNLGVAAKDQGDYVRARALFEESLAIKRREGERRGVAVTLSNLGLTAKAQGDMAAAASFFSESLGLFQGIGDTWGQALCLNNMGTLAFASGDVERALALHKTSLTGRRAMKEKWGVAECLEGLAGVAEAMGDPEGAVCLLAAADRLRQVHGFPLPPDERAPLQRQVAALRIALGEDAFRVAWATGQAWNLEEALDAGLALQLPSAPPAHSAARVRIHLLGPFRLVVDGHPVPETVWGRPAALTLFQYLLVNRHRYVSAGELVEAFWPQAPSVETTAVYTTISRVRRALRSLSLPGQLELTREHAGYRLRLGQEVMLDVDIFMQALQRCGRSGDDAEVAALAEALALYEDDLLAASDAVWFLQDREALRRRWTQACLRLAGLLEGRGRTDEAIAVYVQTLSREPLLEAAHRGLIRCYAHTGRRDLALRQYRLCVEVLARELDVAPEEETQKLYEAVSEGRRVPLPSPQGAEAFRSG